MNKILVIQLSILAIISIIFYIYFGIALALIFVIIWIDKAIFSLFLIAGRIGLELTTIGIILAGMVYGPWIGFLFGFLIVAFVGGLLNVISWIIRAPDEIFWPPFIPSPDHFFDGIVAALAGFLIQDFPFFWVAITCIVIKNALVAFKTILMQGYPAYIIRIFNLIFNIFIIFIFQNYFIALIHL